MLNHCMKSRLLEDHIAPFYVMMNTLQLQIAVYHIKPCNIAREQQIHGSDHMKQAERPANF